MRKYKKMMGAAAVVLTAALLMTALKGEAKQFFGKLTSVSAIILCNQALPKYLSKDTSKQMASTDASSETDLSEPQKEQSSQSTSSNSGASSAVKPENAGTVQTTLLSLTAANTNTSGVHINNKTDLNPDYDALLAKGLPFEITETKDIQVLIVHTHATESYSDSDLGYYDKDNESTRSTDNSKNTVRVGEVLAKVLNDGGIGTINDATQHDNPAYTGSYARSEQTILQYLEKYPSIKVLIDHHRDSISGSGDTKIKPTCEINGKKAAQIMLLAGAETGDITGFPNWKENLQFNLLLQKQLEEDYADLCRPLSFKECIYNFDLLNGSILIEVGSEVNTLHEAEYSAQLFGKTLLKVLKK